jgi:signal transduction histidine kinase
MGELLQRERWDLVAVYLIGMIAIGTIGHLRQISYVGRACTFLGILYALGVIDLSFFGIAEDWRLYFSAFSILSALLLGWRAGLIALLLSLVTFVTLAWQISIGRIVITASAMGSPIPTVENIIAFSLVFVLMNAIVITAIITLLREFEKATEKERQAAIKLGQRTTELEDSLNREQRLASEVAYALQREEELNKLRSKMITTISHEFRTPLTVINNSTSLLDKYYDRLSDSKREEQYLRIRQSIFYLTDLLQGVSLVESTQNRAVRPRQEMIQFGQLCQQLTTELKQETAAPPNLKIDVTGNETTPLILDYYLLKQVILNLLTNALKYSPSHQPVHLHIGLTTNLILTVTDRGVGIPESEKEKVWELFYRGSNVDVHSGLGLGLYVVKQLLESMAGTITLTDNPAGGTIFTVKLPIKQVTDSSA